MNWRTLSDIKNENLGHGAKVHTRTGCKCIKSQLKASRELFASAYKNVSSKKRSYLKLQKD